MLLARALYRSPKVLFLDEATSALDNETEEALIDAIDSLHGSLTIVMIAHRHSTLRYCDSLYELQFGKLCRRTQANVIGTCVLLTL